MTPGLLAADRVCLSQTGKGIFAQELEEVIRRALNKILGGKGIKPGSLDISLAVACQCFEGWGASKVLSSAPPCAEHTGAHLKCACINVHSTPATSVAVGMEIHMAGKMHRLLMC